MFTVEAIFGIFSELEQVDFRYNNSKNHSCPSKQNCSNGYQEKKKTARYRIAQLSQPKMSKSEWLTSYEPKLVWGNQELMWPLSKAALKAQPNKWIESLAIPKKNWQMKDPRKLSSPEYIYSCGRPSVIWLVTDAAKSTNGTSRLESLAKHKEIPKGYTANRTQFVLGCGRSSPIWEISPEAKSVKTSRVMEQLSKPKGTHQKYQPSRNVEWRVSSAAQHANATPRMNSLSKAKKISEGLIREPEWGVSKATLSTEASGRVQELALPRQMTSEYIPHRGGHPKVSRAALKANANDRINALAKPIIRDSMDHVQFDPDAFCVKESAKKAKLTPRLAELALPIDRSKTMPIT